MKLKFFDRLAAVACVLAGAAPLTLHAQELSYDSSAGENSDQGDDGDSAVAKAASGRGPKIKVTPYIEASQSVLAELSPGNDVLTYSSLAAGIDAEFGGRNNQGAVSLRYERRFGWGRKVSDADTLSGVARFSTAIVPHAVTFEVGALAARSSVENNGATVTSLDLGNAATQIYSGYAGPSVSTRMGDVAVDGHYRFGYTRVEAPRTLAVAPGQNALDVFGDSTMHNAELHVGTHAGAPLPVGVGAGVGYNRENVSNLDQQIEDFHARGDIILPIGSDVALVGGVGYEKVKVASRDVLRDTITGLPVVDGHGRFVTDTSAPRQIAFDTSGLIWDAGVLWRPSKRTALEAHFGRRYGSTTYFGSFAYAPTDRMNFNVSVYDSIASMGGLVNSALAALPAQFGVVRNPLNGDLGGCVATQGPLSSGQGACLSGALGSVRSAVFRSRGVMATLAITGNRVSYGIGAGFDQRRFIAAPGTILAVANGTIDENIWLAAYLTGRIDRNSSFGANLWANWYQSGDALAGNSNALGATVSYSRAITSRLSATAAAGLTGVNREALEDIWTAQALAGVRYSF